MSIEVVTICVGYGDFLAQTLPENLPLVDNLVVVTSPEDAETRKVCRKHNVHHILSEEHHHDGPFNKARLINRAFDQIGGRDWILHMDSDIVLPRQFRRLLEWAHLDTRCIYGADRQRVIGWDEWKKFKTYVNAWDNHTHEMGWWFHPHYPMMSRLVSSLHGYTPIGAFQLFHSSEMIQFNSHQKHYTIDHGDAARTDHQFSLQWDRRYRQLLPEILLLHLESETGTHGANWSGRTTKRFGPPIDLTPDPRWSPQPAIVGEEVGRPVPSDPHEPPHHRHDRPRHHHERPHHRHDR